MRSLATRGATREDPLLHTELCLKLGSLQPLRVGGWGWGEALMNARLDPESSEWILAAADDAGSHAALYCWK